MSIISNKAGEKFRFKLVSSTQNEQLFRISEKRSLIRAQVRTAAGIHNPHEEESAQLL